MIQCANHQNKIGKNLCIKCGKWFCDTCMQTISPEPICNGCSISNHSNNSIQLSTFLEQSKKLSLSIVIPMSIVAILFFLTLSYFIHAFFLIPVIEVFGVLFFFLLPKFKKKIKFSSKVISDAQVETVLALTNNRLTIPTLSEKTQTPLTTAEKKLKDMYLDGKLEMEENEGEIFYSNNKKLS